MGQLGTVIYQFSRERTNEEFAARLHVCTPKTLTHETKDNYYNPNPVCLAVSSFQSADLFRRVLIIQNKAPTECQYVCRSPELDSAHNSSVVNALVLLSSRMT